MPVFVHDKGLRIFYAHVPKTGGTYIEDLFQANGFAVHYRATGLQATATRIAPQHYHREIFAQILDLGAFDWAFMTVRNPVDRLLSEYRSGRQGARQKPFGDWLAGIERRFLADPSVRNNHFRPQAAFFDPALDVFRMEDRFDEAWAQRVAERVGFDLVSPTVERRRDTTTNVSVEFTEADIAAAEAFCRRHYGEDYTRFGYADEAPRARSQPATSRSETEPLGASVIPNGTITGLKRDREARYLHRHWQAGVLDQDGHPVAESLLHRRGQPLSAPGSARWARKRGGRALYAGAHVKGYGHFLLEGLSRLWWLQEAGDADIPVVWSAPRGGGLLAKGRTMPSYQRQILDILGIENPTALVTSAVRFTEVIVPQQGFEIDAFFHPDHVRFLARGGFRHRPEPGFRIWLSRSRVTKTETRGIDAIEQRLAAEGWLIYHPQAHPVREQLTLYARAERIAGEEGSALHSLVLLDAVEDLRVDIFPRGDEVLTTYDTIARAKGFAQRVHDLGVPTYLEKERRRVVKEYATLDPILDALLD